MLALLLASNEVFKYCFAAFLLLSYCGRETTPLVLFNGLLISAELFKSIDEFTVCCRGKPMLWLSAWFAYPPVALLTFPPLNAYWDRRMAA